QETDLRDPNTGAPYEYTRVDSVSYRLCAKFAVQDSVAQTYETPGNPHFWRHPAGHHCFEFRWKPPEGESSARAPSRPVPGRPLSEPAVRP
ncbi:MAG: hypothetical protein ACRENS_07750, partial [Candidatus Eiseniibacteriota bacterium]